MASKGKLKKMAGKCATIKNTSDGIDGEKLFKFKQAQKAKNRK